MATECSKAPKLHAVGKIRRKNPKVQDFESLIRKSMPNWSAVWNVLLQDSRKERLYRTCRSECFSGVREIRPTQLKEKIQRKISDLLDKEEILVDLYKKAAEEAKRKEEEFKSKTDVMLQQIEKDKNLMKIFKPAN